MGVEVVVPLVGACMRDLLTVMGGPSSLDDDELTRLGGGGRGGGGPLAMGAPPPPDEGRGEKLPGGRWGRAGCICALASLGL